MVNVKENPEIKIPFDPTEKKQERIDAALAAILKDIETFKHHNPSLLRDLIKSELRLLYTMANIYGFMDGGAVGIKAALKMAPDPGEDEGDEDEDYEDADWTSAYDEDKNQFNEQWMSNEESSRMNPGEEL